MKELSDEKILEFYLTNDLNREIYKSLDKNCWTILQKKDFFEIVFKVLDVITYYEWSWIKKWDYLKSYLAQFNPEYQKVIAFFANVIAEKRIDITNADTKSLIEFLLDLDYNSNNKVNDDLLKAQIIGTDPKKIVEGFCQVRGFLKSQDKIITDFISENEIEIRKRLVPETIITSNLDLQKRIVTHIQEYVKHDIELEGGYRYLWKNDNPLKETDAQPFIKILLNKYCNDTKVYISRESKVANGNVDFTFTDGEHRICLEIKNAHHDDINKAIQTQLPKYMDGEKTKHGIYLVFWYKSDNGFPRPKNYSSMNELKKELEIKIPYDYNIEVIIIDCKKPIMPSRIKNTRA